MLAHITQNSRKFSKQRRLILALASVSRALLLYTMIQCRRVLFKLKSAWASRADVLPGTPSPAECTMYSPRHGGFVRVISQSINVKRLYKSLLSLENPERLSPSAYATKEFLKLVRTNVLIERNTNYSAHHHRQYCAGRFIAWQPGFLLHILMQ